MSIRLQTFQVQRRVSHMWRHMFDRGRSQEQKTIADRLVRCATADRGPNLDSFKKVMLDACGVRDDEWGHKVLIRVGCARSRRTISQRVYVIIPRPSKPEIYSGWVKVEQDQAFTCVVNYLTEDRSCIWNSVELHKQYTLYHVALC